MSEDRKSGKTATVPSMDLDTIRLAWRQADGAKPDVAAPDAPPAKFDAAQTVAAAPADHLRRSSHGSERRTRSGTESRYLCEERRQSRPHHAETFSSSCVLISVRFQAGCRMVIAKSGFIRRVEYLSAHSHAHGRHPRWFGACRRQHHRRHGRGLGTPRIAAHFRVQLAATPWLRSDRSLTRPGGQPDRREQIGTTFEIGAPRADDGARGPPGGYLRHGPVIAPAVTCRAAAVCRERRQMVAIEPMKSALENEGTETCARTGCARQSLTARPKKSAGPSSSRRPAMRWQLSSIADSRCGCG